MKERKKQEQKDKRKGVIGCRRKDGGGYSRNGLEGNNRKGMEAARQGRV